MKYILFIVLGIFIFIAGIIVPNRLLTAESKYYNRNAIAYASVINEIKSLDPNKVYLAFKGTNSKPGEIAKSYNINNSNVSHVGLLYFENNWKVIHVTNTRKNDNNLYIESPQEYYDTISKPTYAAIFEIAGMHHDEIIKDILTYSAKKIYFDLNFDNSNDRYYCSEFVVNILSKKNNFDFALAKKEIVNIQHKYFLGRDTLEYYPVDIFYINKNFIKRHETKF